MLNLLKFKLALRRPSEEGFTLVEIIVTVLIIGILGAAASLSLSSLNESSNKKACQAHYKLLANASKSYAVNRVEPFDPFENFLFTSFYALDLLEKYDYFEKSDLATTSRSISLGGTTWSEKYLSGPNCDMQIIGESLYLYQSSGVRFKLAEYDPNLGTSNFTSTNIDVLPSIIEPAGGFVIGASSGEFTITGTNLDRVSRIYFLNNGTTVSQSEDVPTKTTISPFTSMLVDTKDKGMNLGFSNAFMVILFDDGSEWISRTNSYSN